MKKNCWLPFIVLFISTSAGAQVFSLFKDFNTGTPQGVSGLMKINNEYMCLLDDGIHGTELWKTDGTVTGTVMIKDIRPGATSGTIVLPLRTTINGILFFAANDGIHGLELWKTDGTESGTQMVKDIATGSDWGIGEISFGILNGMVFFDANDGMHGTELWKTDGTEEGTVLVKDFFPGSGGLPPIITGSFNNTLFLSANDGVHGYELWKTNGTEEGTVLVKDINPGAGSTPLGYQTMLSGIAYFQSNDGTHGTELWKTDGTEEGTVMVKDINPGSAHSNPGFIYDINGVLYFAASDGIHGNELWKTDGTEAGTTLIKDIYPGSISGLQRPSYARINDQLFFFANDGIAGNELWKTDGTAAGTVLIKDINPGINDCYGMGTSIAAINGQLIFKATDGVHGLEVWLSNGNAAGTYMLQDIVPGSGDSNPGGFIDINGKVFLIANTPDYGRELWSGDINTALPLTMMDIKGQLSGNDGLVSWKTSSEQNTSNFEIERSTDGRNFIKTGTIAASGNSSSEKQYSYTDRNITSLHAPVVYYRLKMNDVDHKFTYSKIVAINISSNETVVMLYPNPAKESTTLMIAARKKENITYRIVDMHGRTVQQRNMIINEGSNMIIVDTNTLPVGTYTIVLNGHITSAKMKFIKQ